MAESNIELVRRSLEAFAKGDFDAAFAHFDPAAQWRTAADEPDSQVHGGIEGVRAFAESLGELWLDRFDGRMRFDELIDRGEWVIAPWRARLTGRGSGVAVDVEETYAVRVLDGRIVRVDEYRSAADALAALE